MIKVLTSIPHIALHTELQQNKQICIHIMIGCFTFSLSLFHIYLLQQKMKKRPECFSLDSTFSMPTPPATELSTANKLKEQLGKVVADNVLKKALKTYVNKGQRSLLAVTEFGGKVNIQGSKKVIAALKGNPELEYSLHKLFDILNEVSEDEIEDGEVNDDSEVASLNTDVTLPKLFAPFKDKSRG